MQPGRKCQHANISVTWANAANLGLPLLMHSSRAIYATIAGTPEVQLGGSRKAADL